MMDPISGRNRGYCFVTFTEKKAAEEAVRQVTTGVFFNCQIQTTVFWWGNPSVVGGVAQW